MAVAVKESRTTVFVVINCIVAAMGGLLFGYDIGISGGVTSMEEFLTLFFPDILRHQSKKPKKVFCRDANELLMLFTSSLYLAAFFSSFMASNVTKIYGRKMSMSMGGFAFLFGAILNAFAINLETLIMGRLLLGIGIGFVNQSVPIYLSEIAPSQIRGSFNLGFQLAIQFGIVIANVVNYIVPKVNKGIAWRISLGLGAVPAILMLIGTFFLVETPNSVLEHGNEEEAKRILRKIRGSQEIEYEFKSIEKASKIAEKVKRPWSFVMKLKYRAEMVFCVMIPLFQQLTGINAVMFHAPVLLKMIGFENKDCVIGGVVIGVVTLVSTIVAMCCVDRFGRRVLFIQGGIQMMLAEIGFGLLVGWRITLKGESSLSNEDKDILMGLICLYATGFAWSWGPLGWLVPSEICPLEMRSVGQSINVSVNMLFTFVMGQFFLKLLCNMKFTLFFFLAVMILLMTLFIYFLLPETKGVPIEEMGILWREHRFWRKYYNNDDDDDDGNDDDDDDDDDGLKA